MKNKLSKKQKIISVVMSLAVTALVINLLWPRPDYMRKIEDLRQELKPRFDSLNKQRAANQKFFDDLEYLITSGQLDSADSIVNHLLAKNYRSAHYHTLKGQVFEARQQYDSALLEYDYAIAKEPSSNARDRRAGIYINMGRYNEALADYKTIYFFNYDYSYQIGQVFETMNQKDSALKYYTIYLEHYNDTAVQRKVERLKK
jgi:tetratricopeptide (TPR) repeat protein